MKALVLSAPGKFELCDIDLPEPPANWALVRVLKSSVGLFHAQMASGMLDTRGYPRVLGHELVGEVVIAGSPASPPPGTLVVGDAVVGCGICEWCIHGDESICPWMRHLGIDLDGAFAEYTVIPEANIFPLPPDVDLDDAVMLSAVLPAAVHAVTRAAINAGARVAVIGVGSIGNALCQVARAFGATTIVAADVKEDQLSLAANVADATVNLRDLSTDRAVEQIREIARSPFGVDVAFEAAGTPASLDVAVRSVRPGGLVLLMGIVHGPAGLRFDDYLGDFIRREIRIVTTFGYDRRDFVIGNRLFLSGRASLSLFKGAQVCLEDVPNMIATIRDQGTQGKRHIVDVAGLS